MIEYDNYLIDDAAKMNELLDAIDNEDYVFDEWGLIQCTDDIAGVGVELNIYVDRGNFYCGFYVMTKEHDAYGEYWETDMSAANPYDLDLTDPNWDVKIKDFAVKLTERYVQYLAN